MNANAIPLRLKRIPFGRDVLKPPEKKPIFTEFDGSKAAAWRESNVQNAWWLDSTPNQLAVVSEWCLLREIIWTLQLAPVDSDRHDDALKKFSKCFSINLNSDEILVNPNVALASSSAESLKSILSEFASVSTKLYQFRKFFETVFHPPIVNSFLESAQTAPYSIQCYANGLKDFLRIISKTIGKLEIELIQQDLSETFSIIYFYNQLLPHFQMVHTLHDIHTKVYIDFKTNEGTTL